MTSEMERHARVWREVVAKCRRRLNSASVDEMEFDFVHELTAYSTAVAMVYEAEAAKEAEGR